MATGMESGKAPPPLDFDWKHLLQRLTGDVGLPPEITWMIAGMVAFFIGRRIIGQDFDSVRKAIEGFMSIVQIEVTLARSSMANIAWARLLVRAANRGDSVLIAGRMLAIGAGFARLTEYERAIFSSAPGIILPVMAIAVWLPLRTIVDLGSGFSAFCIGVAWLPTAGLTFYWWYSGELCRRRDLVKYELEDLQSHY